MRPILILGIGSPFGDDQLAWLVIDALLEHNLPAHLHLEKSDRPGLNLLTMLAGYSTVYLIDAVKTGNIIGSIQRWHNLEIDNLAKTISSHQIGVAEALQMGRILEQLPADIFLYGIEIGSGGLRAGICAEVMQAIDQLVKMLLLDL